MLQNQINEGERIPNPEVRESDSRKKRKYRTAEHKLRILKEMDLSRGKPGAMGALLRREGLSSSTVTGWRKERESGALSALNKVRGRKPKHTETDLRMQKLELENAELRERIRQAGLIIEAQKKIAAILGNPVDEEKIALEVERRMSCRPSLS